MAGELAEDLGDELDEPEEFLPRIAREEGCDLTWEEAESEEGLYASVVSSLLEERGYCVVQLSFEDEVLAEALRSIKDLEDYESFRDETIVDFLGRDNATKVKKVPRDIPTEEPSDALGFVDRHLTIAGQALCPVAPEALNCELIGRLVTFARLPFADLSEEISQAPLLSSADAEEGRVLEEYFQFMHGRKVCMILVLHGEGTAVTLFPKPGQGEEVRIPLGKNRLLLFRHDLMSYQYEPSGESAALQSWLLAGIHGVQLESFNGSQQEFAQLLNLTGPWQPDGDQTMVKSLMVRMPGKSWGYINYWTMFTAGTDCVNEWQNSRWDTELYYEPDRDKAMMIGKSYMHHGGFLDEVEFNCFDNEFFGYSPEEAMCMYPGQRIVLEVGYEALWRAGLGRDKLIGENIGVHLGDVGPDWHSIDQFWPTTMMEGGELTLKRMGVSASVTCSRLSHCLGLSGPTNSVATACSSSLVALNISHHDMVNVREDPERVRAGVPVYERALVVGINTLMAPFSFMGQCSMGATTYKGRCFTFDVGADGYQRGEGCSATYIQMNSNEGALAERMACVIGSAVNQDGRSASLTAPNGPSQSALCRQAMQMAKLSPPEVTAAECHGTGTALGDPIEVGALQAVLSKRSRAILKTSAKSNMAHLEASAGMAGYAKCLMMIMGSATPPNLHLKVLNPHLTVEGYPVFFTTELTAWGQNSGYCGVSSFGIGGTNARGEILGRCRRGPEATASSVQDLDLQKLPILVLPCPRCRGPMTWMDSAAVPNPSPEPFPEKYQMQLIRDEHADYTVCSLCYDGEFRHGTEFKELANPRQRLFMRGSWDAYEGLKEMEETDPGTYVCDAIMGSTRVERFQILMEKSDELVIHPVEDDAKDHWRIEGPDGNGHCKRWLIDCRDTQVPAGTVFRITFHWRTRRSISWATLKTEYPEKAAGYSFKHRYSVRGSWTAWSSWDMQQNPLDTSCYQMQFRMGPVGAEEFQILRDRDEEQVYCPAEPGVPQQSGRTTPLDILVSGPDKSGSRRRWVIAGREGERVTVRLTVSDAKVKVAVQSASLGERSWCSQAH